MWLINFHHLFIALILLPCATPDIASARAALVALRNAVGGRVLFWNLSSPTPCSWAGVVCSPDKSSVVELHLPSMADGALGPPSSQHHLQSHQSPHTQPPLQLPLRPPSPPISSPLPMPSAISISRTISSPPDFPTLSLLREIFPQRVRRSIHTFTGVETEVVAGSPRRSHLN